MHHFSYSQGMDEHCPRSMRLIFLNKASPQQAAGKFPLLIIHGEHAIVTDINVQKQGYCICPVI
jgi:hypothetical protein